MFSFSSSVLFPTDEEEVQLHSPGGGGRGGARRRQRGGAESPKQGPSGVFSGFSEVLGARSVLDGQGSGISWMGQARRKTRRRVGGDFARDPCG